MQNTPELREYLEVSEIQNIQETIRKNIVLAEILGEQHTTQPFSCAEDLALAFQGALEKVDDSLVQANIDEALSEFLDKYHQNKLPFSLYKLMHKAGVIQEDEECLKGYHGMPVTGFVDVQRGKFMEDVTPEVLRGILSKVGIDDEALKKFFEKVWIYSRLTNPMNELLEEVLSLIEKSEQTATFASGLAAIDATIKQFVPTASMGEDDEYIKGGKIVVIGAIYGGTYAQIQRNCKQVGIQFEHLPIKKFEKEGLPEDCDMVFFEASNNPNLNTVPLDQVAKEAERVGAISVCDNTFTPLLVRPGDHGIDLRIHSMTKYIGGKSEDLGGCVSGKKELISQFLDLHDGERMTKGGVMAPRVAKEFLKNVEDLPERLYKASENARGVMALATKYDLKVQSVETSRHYESIKDPVHSEFISNGMIALDLGSAERARQFVNIMIKKGAGKGAVSLGATTTYYSIPAETTHSEIDEKEQRRAGITPGLVRISCGTEENLVELMDEVLKELCEVPV